MKGLLKIALGLVLAAGVVACGDKGGDDTPKTTESNLIENNITSNTTWKSGQVYTLGGRIAVESGATLTIEPGVVIKGKAGVGANATALIVARGAKIMAEGTATQPIIFTSTADDIQPGQVVSPNMPAELNGLWGGLIVLGNAKGSFKNGATEAAIEGIPATDLNGRYGGNDNEDNSGVIKYVSVRHGGANIGLGNEINGITLGGVGRGTQISYVEVVSNQDDGIEWFGGSVNVTNAVVWNAGDDAIDTDQAWEGTLDNFVVINAGDKCFELDGPEGALEGAGHTLKNGTVFAENAVGLIDYDANTDVNMSNIYFTMMKEGQGVDEYEKYVANTKGYASSNFQATLPTTDNDGNPATYTKADFFGPAAGIVTEVSTPTVGANKAAFNGWSMAAASGKLN